MGTAVELTQKAGVSKIFGKIVNELKDEAEPYRKMVMETITKVVATLGASDIDERLEVRLVDCIIYSFQEQTTAGCFRYSQCSRYPREAISYSDRLHDPMASQHQECQSSSAGSRFDDSPCGGHQAMQRGPTFEQGGSRLI